MILASHGLIASQIASFDADAVAFFNRVTTAGGSLSATEKAAVNQLVLDLKANSLWTPMKAIYPMVGASAAACAQNLKSSSFTGTFTSGWTFASTGVTPNGTSAFMDTNFLESTNLTLNSEHISVYLRTNVSALSVDIGTEGVAGQSNIFPNFGGSYYPRVQANNGGIGVSYNTAAFFLANRVISTEIQGWRNTTKNTLTNASSGLSNTSICLSVLPQVGGTKSFFSTRQNAFASIGDGLTDTQASNFYTAVQAFQTTLSRQV